VVSLHVIVLLFALITQNVVVRTMNSKRIPHPVVVARNLTAIILPHVVSRKKVQKAANVGVNIRDLFPIFLRKAARIGFKFSYHR